MKITFHVNYRTSWGESLYLTGEPKALGGGDISKAVAMSLTGSETWSVTVELPDSLDVVTYGYIVRHDDGTLRREWGKMRRLERHTATKNIYVTDRWQDQPWDKPYYSAAFTDCICKRQTSETPVEATPGYLTLAVDAPMVAPDEAVAVSGESDALGRWDQSKLVIMNDADYPTWKTNVPLGQLKDGMQYKFLIVKKANGEVIAWESRDNRVLSLPAGLGDADSAVDAGQRLVNPLAPWRGAGVAIPVFSLRSDDDFGVGDFMDLKKMIDWAVATKQNFVQVLPINDTTMSHTWTDSYPYNANSTFALHPMYLRLSAMGSLADEERQRYYDDLRHELNRLPQVDYERVNNAKNSFTRELFAQNGAADRSTPEFRAFLERNASWLTPYAAFCVLRDINGTPDMSRWGEYAVYDTEKVQKFIDGHLDDINYVYYLHEQNEDF